ADDRHPEVGAIGPPELFRQGPPQEPGRICPPLHLAEELVPLFSGHAAPLDVGAGELPPMVEEADVVVLLLEGLDLLGDDVVRDFEVHHSILRSSHHGKNEPMSAVTVIGNSAGRFSRNDITPSRASAVRPRSQMMRESSLWASMGWSAPNIRHNMWRERATDVGDVFSAISSASARAAGNSWSGAWRLRTRRPASASSAGNTRPVITHSIAWLIPTTRGRNHDDAASGTNPRRANTKPKRAWSEASRTSIGSVIV